jgi:hypothetical protein
MSTRLPRYGLLDKSTGEWLTAGRPTRQHGQANKRHAICPLVESGEPGAYNFALATAELKNLIVRPLIEESVAA